MSHYTVHPTTDGKWLVSEGNSPMINAATEHSANIIATAMEKAHGHNPLNQLPPPLRKLAETFITFLQGIPMPVVTTNLNASIAPLNAAIASALPLIENQAATTAAQSDVDAATANNVTLTNSVTAAVAAAQAPAPVAPPAA